MHCLPSTIVSVILTTTLYTATVAINCTFVVEVIQNLDSVYRFSNLPIFSALSTSSEQDHVNKLSRILSESISIPQLVLATFSTEELRFLINKNSLSLILADSELTSIDNELTNAAARLRGMHGSKVIIVFCSPMSLKRLSLLQSWLWTAQFTNVLILFEDQKTQQNQIFTIDPYPSVKWLNLTSTTDPRAIFDGDHHDLKGYRIEIPYTSDIPRTFQFNNQLVGRHAMIIVLFAKRMNITLVCNYEQHLDTDQILRDFHTKSMELSVHSYSMFDLEEIGSSYPLETVRWCIMVPLRSEVAKSEYVIIAFDRTTWLCICFGVIYIAILMRFIDPPTKNTQKRFFLRSLTILMYSPNMAERMTGPTVRQFAFFAQVFLLGFILSCFYSTYVTSFCTNMVFQEPIDTVADLVKENLRIMVVDYELEAIRKRATYGEIFLRLLYPVSYFEAVNHSDNLDGRFAYNVRQDRWQFLDKQQRGLEKPFFRLSKICFGRHFTMFPLQVDSHLQSQLDLFTLRVAQAGLDLFWDEEAFRMTVAMNYSRMLVEMTVVVQPLKLDYFKHVYTVWGVGIGVSTLCFLVEVTIKKIKDIKVALKRLQEIDQRM